MDVSIVTWVSKTNKNISGVHALYGLPALGKNKAPTKVFLLARLGYWANAGMVVLACVKR